MGGILMHLVWSTILIWVFKRSGMLVSASDSCGQLEIVRPAIDGRNVSLKFSPTNVLQRGTATWRMSRTGDSWIDLANNTKFVQYIIGNVHYLTITKSDKDIDGILYKVEYTDGTDLHCTTNYADLDLKVLDGCGLLYLRTDRIVENGTVELGYFPTSHMLEFPKSYVRCWLRYSEEFPQGRCVDTGNGFFDEILQQNYEYVLKIHNFQSVTGSDFKMQCTTGRIRNKYTKPVHVTLPVSPSTLTLSPLETIDNCVNCIVGEDKQRIQVSCKIIGGTEPYNVTLRIGDSRLKEINYLGNGEYKAFFRLNNTLHHMANLTCFVENHATTQPLSVTAVVFITILSRTAPSLHIPSRLIEGDPVSITCLKTNIRPAATNITMMIDGNIIYGLELVHDIDNTTLLYNSWVTLTKFQRNWNQKDVTCCDYNEDFFTDGFRLCSSPKYIDFIFPPDNVTLYIAHSPIEERRHYVIEAECHINHSNPVCNASWSAPYVSFVEQSLRRRATNAEDESTSSIFSAKINVSVTDVGKFVTCTPTCNTDFNGLLSSSWTILVPHRPVLEFNTSYPSVRIRRGLITYVKCSARSYPTSSLIWNDALANESLVTCERKERAKDGIIETTPFGDYGTTDCTLVIDTRNTTTDMLRFVCIAGHLFGSVEKILLVRVYDIDTTGYNTVAIVFGCGGSSFAIIICLCLVAICKQRNTKGGDIMNPALNRHEQQHPAEREEEGEQAYADLDFDGRLESPPYAIMKRRPDSCVDYVSVLFDVNTQSSDNNDK